MGTAKLEIRPITFRSASEYVSRTHRHHPSNQGCKFAVSAWIDGQMVGVAIAGRPVSRMLDDGQTIEITRVATDGTKNACSFLYGAVNRVAKEMGYKRSITYTLATETGASLRASNWTRSEIDSKGGEWGRLSRTRIAKAPTDPKIRWEKTL